MKIKSAVWFLVFGIIFGYNFFILNVERVEATVCKCNVNGSCIVTDNQAECERDVLNDCHLVDEVCPELEGPPEGTFCFCYDDPAKIDITNYKTAEKDFLSTSLVHCVDGGKVLECNPEKVLRGGAKKYDACSPAGKLQSASSCKDQFTIWQGNKRAKLEAGTEVEQATGVGVGAFFPACINTKEGCRDVGVFVEMGINIADYLFGIIGALTLLMFVYGGIMMVISGGSPERVKKGTDILVTAVIGLVIVFGAYALIKFVGGELVKTDYVLR